MGLRGAKVALMIGPSLLVLRRDHTPGISHPGMRDLPGGEIEPGETIRDCARREVREEEGLILADDQLRNPMTVMGAHGPFAGFTCHLAGAARGDIRFGDEGLGWELMTPHRFVEARDAIPSLARMVRDYITAGALSG